MNIRSNLFYRFGLIVLLTITGPSGILRAQEKPIQQAAPVTAAQMPKGVSIYQLDNGMQVLLIENPALPMIGANVIVKVGSAYESFSSSGMSHMLEHLLFN